MTNKQAYAGLPERLREQANHFRRTSPALTDEHWLMLGDEAAEAISSLLKAAQRALNFIENTESELGIQLESGDMLRAALSGEKL